MSSSCMSTSGFSQTLRVEDSCIFISLICDMGMGESLYPSSGWTYFVLSLCKLSFPVLQLIPSRLMKWQDTSLKTCFGSDFEAAKCLREGEGGSCDCRQAWGGSRRSSSGCRTNFRSQLLWSGFCTACNTGYQVLLIGLRFKILFQFSVFLV